MKMKKLKIQIPNNVTKNRLYYLAGFLDGEGCIQIKKSNRSRITNKSPEYSVAVTISNTDITIPKMLRNIFGGSIFERKFKRKWKNCYDWKVSNKKAIYFCKIIKPYLIMKQKQADNAILFGLTIEYWGAKRVSNETLNIREMIYMNNKKLNKRGKN